MNFRQAPVPVAGQYITPQLCPEDFGITVHPARRAMASAFSMSFFGCLRSLIMPQVVASCQHGLNAPFRGLIPQPRFDRFRRIQDKEMSA